MQLLVYATLVTADHEELAEIDAVIVHDAPPPPEIGASGDAAFGVITCVITLLGLVL